MRKYLALGAQKFAELRNQITHPLAATVLYDEDAIALLLGAES
jgi:hypothetical protein